MEQAAKNIESFVASTQKDEIRERIIDAYMALMIHNKLCGGLTEQQLEDMMFELKMVQNLIDAVHTIPIVFDNGILVKAV